MQPWTAPPVPSLPGAGGPVRLRASPAGDLVVAAPGPTARMYVCGITPYDATHLGHAATYLAFDLLHRAWLDAGQEVLYAQNVTDVDDPLLERATATGVDWRELAASQIDLFAQDMAALRVLPPHAFEGAVEAIGRIVPAVEELLGRGAAYRVGEVDGAGEGADDVYFDLGADPRFGEVARLDRPTALALSAERGGDPQRRGKRDPLDPLLWRGQRPGEPSWDGASLGPGRPGWHIECAVIAHEHLGTAFDVQGGGSDLLFPHHEMSASHGHVLHGWPFARTYAHAGMVGLDGVKMSKSLGNLVLVSRLRADGVDPMAVRLAVLGHRWRSDWSWTDAGLADAQRRLATWRRAVAHSLAGDGDGDGGRAVLAAVRAALADDLDAPAALAEVDAWAGAALAGDPAASGGALVRDLVDALLGVRL